MPPPADVLTPGRFRLVRGVVCRRAVPIGVIAGDGEDAIRLTITVSCVSRGSSKPGEEVTALSVPLERGIIGAERPSAVESGKLPESGELRGEGLSPSPRRSLASVSVSIVKSMISTEDV